jgi:hypothetical protein
LKILHNFLLFNQSFPQKVIMQKIGLIPQKFLHSRGCQPALNPI